MSKTKRNRTKISTSSIIPKKNDNLKEKYALKISTFEYLRFYTYLCPSLRIKSKVEFLQKATEVIQNYSSIITLINVIQQSESLKNYLIKNQNIKMFDQLLKRSMMDKIGVYDKSIFSKRNIE